MENNIGKHKIETGTEKSDVVIIGGSLGGVLAAYSAAKNGLNVILCEETDWIGGQLTSQAVPPDEHKYIETTGCTESYRAYRNAVRAHYHSHPDIIPELKQKEFFCPGGSSVSRLSHPPLLALKLLNQMLMPYVNKGNLKILLECKLLSAVSDGVQITSVSVENRGEVKKLFAKIFIDGTDTGELLEKANIAFVTGAESRADTGELLAPEKADPSDNQPCTYVLAFDYNKKNSNIIEKPERYDYYKNMKMPYDKYNILSMYGPDSATGKAKLFGFFNGETEGDKKLFGLFTYRRFINKSNFVRGVDSDVTTLNWPQNDYFMNNIFGTSNDAEHLHMAKQLSLSLIYFLQTELNHTGISLRADQLGTTDGLAKAPYIRESRRILPIKRVVAQDIDCVNNSKPVRFDDSVGVGMYHIDLHITTSSHTFLFREAQPFDIPLSAIVPRKAINLLPACKNIGTTHLTNGCYRLHPIEWNIGESVGHLCAYMLQNGISAAEVSQNRKHLKKYQDLLIQNGIQLHW